jgi:hypothetical protein
LHDLKLVSDRWRYRIPASIVAAGFAVWGALLPSTTAAGVRVAAAVGGVLGGGAIVGALTLFALTLAAPHRQRDEARREINRLRAPSGPVVDTTAKQVARLDEMVGDGTRLLASNAQGSFAANLNKWTGTVKDELRDLTDESESILFEREGVGVRNAAGSIDPHAGLLAQVNYLRDKVKPKLREGYWPTSPFCDRERELARRADDGDPEMFVIDRLRLADGLRRRLTSTEPPENDAVGTWAADTVQGFWDRSLGYLGDRFTDRGEGSDDSVEPPHDWAAAAAYLDRRRDALLSILQHLRGEG